jgi:DNA invertase Pin-like site-specific DNA recombinase
MLAHFGRFVSYLRVSTDKQGESGLGIEAQRAAIEGYLNGGSWKLHKEFVEVESGKRSDNRPQLAAALALCRKEKCKLVVAKLDRLSRNVAFLSALMESRVEFVAVDNPHATKLTIHILAAVAEHEREMISQRTKDGLAAAKARNVKLGNPRLKETAGTKGAEANKVKAKAFADNVLPIIHKIEKQGAVSLRAIAAELTARKIKTASGGTEWNPVTVSKIKRRATT